MGDAPHKFKIACYDLDAVRPSWEKPAGHKRKTALGHLEGQLRQMRAEETVTLLASCIHVAMVLNSDGEWVPLRDKDGRVIAY